MKINKLNFAICGIAFCVMLFYCIFGDGAAVAKAVTVISPVALLVALALMAAYWLLDCFVLHIYLKAMHTPQKLRTSVSTGMLGQYYNCVTPFSSGGQPLQAYRLTQNGVPLGVCMTALLAKFITFQVVLTVMTALLLLFRLKYFFADLKPLAMLTFVGFAVNTAVLAALFALAFLPRFSKRIAYWFVFMLGKVKVFKNPNVQLKKMRVSMNDFREKFIFVRKNPFLIFRGLLLTVAQLLAYLFISYALYRGFFENTGNWLTIIACQSFVLLVSAFMPLPGGMGAAEGGYAAFMKGLFGSYTAFSMLVWRFLTFYLPILIGIVMSSVMSVKTKNNIDICERQINTK